MTNKSEAENCPYPKFPSSTSPLDSTPLPAKEKNTDSIKDEAGTPRDFFQRVHFEFHFNVDACASSENHKLAHYWIKEEDGLKQSWAGLRVWCNPPYSRGQKELWIRKAYAEVIESDCILAVLLLPTMTEQKVFHELIYRQQEIRFVAKRLTFEKPKEFVGEWSTGRDSHMLVVFRNPSLLVW